MEINKEYRARSKEHLEELEMGLEKLLNNFSFNMYACGEGSIIVSGDSKIISIRPKIGRIKAVYPTEEARSSTTLIKSGPSGVEFDFDDYNYTIFYNPVES